MTVSKVLNGKTLGIRRDARERAEKIHQVAKELGYRPNTAARAMVLGCYHSIGLLQTRAQHGMITRFRSITEELADKLAARKYHLTFGLAFVDDFAPTVAPKILNELLVDGLIVDHYLAVNPLFKRLIQQVKLPTLWLNSREARACVYPDDTNGARTATRHLIDLGHRRIAYVALHTSSDFPHYSCGDRKSGYLKAMAARGLTPLLIEYDGSPPDLMAHMMTLLKKKIRPTAIVAYDYREAYCSLTAALQCGLTVPQDLSIIGFNDEFMNLSGIRIDTLQIPIPEMAQCAVNCLLENIEAGTPMPAISLPISHLPGETVAAPPGMST